MADEPLNGIDLAFLSLEQESAPMHFGGLALFNAAAQAGATKVKQLVLQRVAQVPRLRQRVKATWLPPGSAVWTEDSGFHVEGHVQLHHLRPPGDQDQLIAVMAEVMAPRLPLDRPLW